MDKHLRLKDTPKAFAYNQSRVKLYLRCRKAYWYRYDSHGKPNAELVPKRSSLPLKKGSWMHELLQAHWLFTVGRGDGWEAKHEELSDAFHQLFEEEQDHYGDLPTEAERLFRAYLRVHHDEDKKFRVAVLPDGSPGIEFVVAVPLDRWGIGSPFKGRIDLLVEDLEFGGYWIRDAKWVRSIPGPDERMMSPQNPLYVWALRRSLGIDVRGFIYDYGRTKAPTIPAPLKRGGISLAKKYDTTVPIFLEAAVQAYGKKRVRELIQEDGKFAARLKEIKAGEKSWFRRERIPVELHKQKQALREFVAAVREIERRNTKVPARTYLYSCKFSCSYHEPCCAEFAGLDIQPLLNRNYVIEEETYAPEESELVG